MFRECEYAVLDVETTGVSPAHHDRIVEIGLVRVDCNGNVISEYGTLINPDRDVGPTPIHGIRAKDVLDAPRFKEVVGDIFATIKGAVLVAHNASFDLRFLRYECDRCGVPLPPVVTLCTLALSRAVVDDVPSRKLSALCDYFGIENTKAHSALDDAHATAALLTAVFDGLRNSRDRIPLADLGAQGAPGDPATWPSIEPSRREYRRTDAMLSEKQADGRLSRLFEQLPAQNSTNYETDQYLDLLERALEDRHVSDDELRALEEMAISLDMDQDEVREVHRAFLRDLLRVALLDDIITEAERQDIETVAGLLGIPASEYEAMANEARSEGRPPSQPAEPKADLAGMQICFTGTFSSLVDGECVTRDMMEEIAASHGMVVKKTVTKSLDCLVCADPDTMSGKAKKARDYGIRIIAEPAFFKMING